MAKEFIYTKVHDLGKIGDTTVIVRKIIGNIVFVQIPMEYDTYQNLYGTEDQLDNLIENRSRI